MTKTAPKLAAIVWLGLACWEAPRGSTLAAPAPPPAALSAEEVIARHVQAYGGEAAWRKLAGIQLTGAITYLSNRSSFTLRLAPRGRSLLETGHGAGRIQIGCDGRSAWRRAGGERDLAQRLTGLELAMAIRDSDFPTPLFDHLERGHAVTLLGRQVFEGRPALALSVRRRDGLNETWYLDPDTWLAFARESPGSRFGQEVLMRTWFDDFRTVSGITLPFRIDSQWHVMERVLEVESAEIGVPIDDALFAMPRPAGMRPLLTLAGSWAVIVSQTPHPGAPVQTSERRSTIVSRLEGALLEEEYSTPRASVVRTLTHDPFRQVYRMTEISDQTTLLDVQEGVLDGEGRLVLTNLATGTPLLSTGRTVHSRTTFKDIAPDRFTVDREISTDGGKEWLLASSSAYRRNDQP